MKFYLGTHKVAQHWWDAGVPLFVSRRTLFERKSLPRARAEWALDSGGFTELSEYGEWTFTEDEYVRDVRRFESEIGHLGWVAPMDWMCEPKVLRKTGLTVGQHQRRTIENFLRLRDELGDLVVPVLQGWELDDYLWCWWEYDRLGVDLGEEQLVGLGSVCRRQDTAEAGVIVRNLAPHMNLHYFGAKITGLESFGEVLYSADSMAWSKRARHSPPLRGCHHQRCNNCIRFAMRWREQLMGGLAQTRLEVVR